MSILCQPLTTGETGEFLPYKICKKGNHSWSLCLEKDKASSPSLMISSACSNKKLQLPLFMVTRRGKKYILNCLLDLSSQRLLNDEVAKKLGIKIDSLSGLQFNMKTFLGEDSRYLKESLISITMGGNSLPCKALFNRNINLNLPISRLADLIRNFKATEFKLAADFDKVLYMVIRVEGLIVSRDIPQRR